MPDIVKQQTIGLVTFVADQAFNDLAADILRGKMVASRCAPCNTSLLG
jgi:hypothetical protein